ncbi:hypothetical protein RB653_006768 [Dictyostelium firmibasis]|uniref:Helix-hairpin-helix domain-containing protein n=1 Tax=Dictyostelium firmibasis TaxID=79012 RepID=A0AAN7TV14_9MYCE
MGVIIDLCKCSFSLVSGLFKKKDVLAQMRIRTEIGKERQLKWEQEQKSQIIKPIEIKTSINNNIKSEPKNINISSGQLKDTPIITTNIQKETFPITGTSISTSNNNNNKVYTDLINIKGIGPITIKELNNNGITSAEQLAKLSDQDCEKLKSKIKKIYSVRNASHSLINDGETK